MKKQTRAAHSQEEMNSSSRSAMSPGSVESRFSVPAQSQGGKVESASLDDSSLQATQPQLAIFDDSLRILPLQEGALVIGRSKRSQLQLHDHLLSRKHCTLTLAGDKLILVDLNSSNGTFVNGREITTSLLQTDDIIELGHTIMVVFDGESWGRGEGLLNLRNPLKAQELVQRLKDPRAQLRVVEPRTETELESVPQVGLSELEQAFLSWLEQNDSGALPAMIADYISNKLISLMVQNSPQARSSLTSILEGMMRPEFFQQFESIDQLKACVIELAKNELHDLRHDPEPLAVDRGLLDSSCPPNKRSNQSVD